MTTPMPDSLRERINAVLTDQMPCPVCGGEIGPCQTCGQTGRAQFDACDRFILKWQYSHGENPPLLGHFYLALADAITRADDTNLERLKLGFPVEVEGFLRWNRGDLAQRLRAVGVCE